MALKVVVKDNVRRSMRELDKSAKEVVRELPSEVFRALSLLEAEIKQNLRQGSGLRVVTGTLLNSVQKNIEVKRTGGNLEVIGSVGPEGVPYAPVHEFGHKFPARRVEPRNAKVLAWEQGGKTFFSKGHTIPSFEVPARPYISPAVEKWQPIIEDKFALFVEKMFKEK